MTISNDGRLTPPERPDQCHVCGDPVGFENKYYDVHDKCQNEGE